MIAPIDTFGESGAARKRRSPPAHSPPVLSAPCSATSDATSESLIQRSLGRHPTAAVISSLVVGVTLGWIIKRKWIG